MCTAGNKYRPNQPDLCGCGNLKHSLWQLKCQHKEDLQIIQQLKEELAALQSQNCMLITAVTDFLTENLEEYIKLEELDKRLSLILKR